MMNVSSLLYAYENKSMKPRERGVTLVYDSDITAKLVGLKNE